MARTPDGPASSLTTQTSQALAPYIGNASTWRSTSIQRPGRGAERHRAGHRRQQGVGRREAQAHHQKHQHRHGRWRGKAGGDRDAHERRGAWRRHHHGERPVKKLPSCPPTRGQALAGADQAGAHLDTRRRG